MKNSLYKIIFSIIFGCAVFTTNMQFLHAQVAIQDNLTFDDLVKLSSTKNLPTDLKQRLYYVLYTPIVDNTIEKNDTQLNHDSKIGDFVRIASWNIDRGLNIDYIKSIFSSSDDIMNKITDPKVDKKKVKEQINILRKSDIIVLNEVDWGMPRTSYKNIAEEIAKTLGYNYAYGTEFVEVDPAHLGLENNEWSEEKILFPNQKYEVNKTKYKGLHGNAILSRFPLKNVRIIRLPQYYDWFGKEQKKITEIEYVRREASEKIFREDVIREIRRGSRIALLADVDIPEFKQPLTIVATHLENRVIPKYRCEQMKVLLNAVKNINNPVILAGDLNTTTADASPTSIRREIYKKLSDPEFLAREVVYCFIPYTFAISSVNGTANYLRTYKNPAVMSIPVISPNKERGLFVTLQKFKFDDGGQFDFSGNKYKSVNERTHLLADSNQRDFRGFTPTFIFERPLFIGKFKLDWIFVKPTVKESKKDKIIEFEPFYGRTLLEMNYAFDKLPSDHSPVTVDLPINPPTDTALKKSFSKSK